MKKKMRGFAKFVLWVFFLMFVITIVMSVMIGSFHQPKKVHSSPVPAKKISANQPGTPM